jgi:hypothetical protein
MKKSSDPESGMEKCSDPIPGSGIKHPVSATLVVYLTKRQVFVFILAYFQVMI